MHPKYHNSYYWEKLIQNRVLRKTFNQERISKESVFFQGIIYNSFGHRKLLEDVFHFSSLDALTGYLQYVFLPTVFLSFTNEEKGIIVPLGLSLAELIDYVSNNDFIQYHNYQRPMYQLLEMSENLLHMQGREEILKQLRRMESHINYSFQIDRDAYAMMHIYTTARDLGEYFSGMYQIDGNKQLGAELFYHKTGLRKAEWEYLCQHAEENIFISRKFMNCIASLVHTQ